MISDDYAPYHDDIIRMLELFKWMLEDHVVHIRASTRTVELNPTATRPKHSESHCTRGRTRNYEESEIDNILSKKRLN